MIEVSVSVDLDETLDQLKRYCREALVRTGETVIDDIENAQVVPIMRSTLVQTLRPLDVSELDQNKVSIHSDTPYARRLYEHPEYNFHREPWSITHKDGRTETFPGNPNARGEWFEPWESGNRKPWVSEQFAKHLKAVMK